MNTSPVWQVFSHSWRDCAQLGPPYAIAKLCMKRTNNKSLPDPNTKSLRREKFTRRGFLKVGSTALAVAGIVPSVVALDRSRSDPGPANQTLDGQNQDSMWPP